MLGGNDISKVQTIGSGPRVAMLAAAIFLLSIPLLFAQTDPQPSPEAKAEKNLNIEDKKLEDKKLDDKSEKKADDPKRQKIEDPERKFAAQCGIDFDKATRRALINSVSRGWREHSDTTRPPELADDEEIFTVRADAARRYVRAVRFGDDFDTYQDDCFDESGKLKFFQYEFRTVWGWGYEEARNYDPTGKLLEKTTRFLDTQSEKTIEEPEHAKDVADEMKPKVHKTYGVMPFIHFFEE
jgi:hypothetical protein